MTGRIALSLVAAALCLAGDAVDAGASERPRRLRRNERNAVAILGLVHAAQQAFQASALADVDGDGIGEFGGLLELTGAVPARRAADGSARWADPRADPPLLPTVLGELHHEAQAVVSGYCFRVFLPAAGGGAVGEEQFLDSVAGEVHVDRAETTWCAYAWPRRWGRSGRWTFFVNQDGVVTGIPKRWYSGRQGVSASRAGAALIQRGPLCDDDTYPYRWGCPRPPFWNGNLAGDAALGATGRDGGVWYRVGLADQVLPADRAVRLTPGRPPRRRDRRAANEAAAISALRRVFAAQKRFQEIAAADVDVDGVGEYGMLRELAGAVAVRDSYDGTSSRPPLDPPLLPAAFGELNANAELEIDGYLLKTFLPYGLSSYAHAVEETPRGDSLGGVLEDIDASEAAWFCYAWPVRHGRTGRSTYFVDASGVITRTDSEFWSGTGALDVVDAGAAFRASVDELRRMLDCPDPTRNCFRGIRYHIGGERAVGSVGRDGSLWEELWPW